MIRKSSISTFLALLIISAMTLADTRTWVFEIDEIIEGTEIENEELKEGSEIEREWLKLLTSGGPDFVSPDLFRFRCGALSFITSLGTHTQALPFASAPPLFIIHCSLKIHLV